MVAEESGRQRGGGGREARPGRGGLRRSLTPYATSAPSASSRDHCWWCRGRGGLWEGAVGE